MSDEKLRERTVQVGLTFELEDPPFALEEQVIALHAFARLASPDAITSMQMAMVFLAWMHRRYAIDSENLKPFEEMMKQAFQIAEQFEREGRLPNKDTPVEFLNDDEPDSASVH